jgi:hypothetical protein
VRKFLRAAPIMRRAARLGAGEVPAHADTDEEERA